jgi:hypothetical protein
MKFRAEIKSGKLKIHDHQKMIEYCSTLKDGIIIVNVYRPKKSRSLPQNNYLHGVIIKMLSDYLGYEFYEMKGIIKWLFGIKHTSELSTKESEELYEAIRRWALKEFDFTIPLPE